ncbi:hypothetical protein [Nonomuraea endophytica]|uniref:hypothetical protein n=1 Tax=Nonomuraea endophytica TaxID=714136 RepID=UPI0037CB43D7
MNTVLDWTGWAERHPVTAVVIGVFVLIALVIAVLTWRVIKRFSGATWRRYVAPRPIEDVLTIVAASIATGVSAQGMWRFSGDVLGLDGPLRVLLFAFVEVAIVTSAVRARRNMRENFSAGLDGIAVWALTCLTAVLSSLDASNLPEAVFRLAAPLVAAWLWERGMAIERHRIRGTGRINWRLTPERMLVRLGVAETRDRSAQEVDAHRRITQVALAAKRAKMLRATGTRERKMRAALAKLDKAMDRAVEHAGVALDRDRQTELLAQIAALYNTAALLDAEPAPPWELKKETPVPSEALEAIKAIARAEGRAELRNGVWTGGRSAASPDGSSPTADPVIVERAQRQREGTAGTAPRADGKQEVPPARPAAQRSRDGAGTKSGTIPRPHRGRVRGRNEDRPPEWDSVDELMPLGWRIVADLQKAERNLTRDTLRDAVRATGTKVSTKRATVLLRRLRAEAPSEPPLKISEGGRPQGTSGPTLVPSGDEAGTSAHLSAGDEPPSSPPTPED